MRDPVAEREAFNKRVTVMEAGVDAGAEDFALEVSHIGECMSGAGDGAAYDCVSMSMAACSPK
jgi:hypothetical protein